jgi:hypothetical protein
MHPGRQSGDAKNFSFLRRAAELFGWAGIEWGISPAVVVVAVLVMEE